MSIQQAEQLKREWTDSLVRVQPGVPELRRFEGFTGTVKTVNMNCRVLVQFDTPADISWYDIDPRFLTVIGTAGSDEVPSVQEPQAPSAKPQKAPPARSTAASTGTSPLDLIRSQTSGRKDAQTQTANPLDQIRAQATNTSGAAPTEPQATDTTTATVNDPAAAPVSGQAEPNNTSNAAMNPLDQIRAQSAIQSDDGAENEAAEARPASTPTASAGPSAVNDPVPLPAPRTDRAEAPTADDTEMNPLDQIRAQAGIDSGSAQSRDSQFDQVRVQANRE